MNEPMPYQSVRIYNDDDDDNLSVDSSVFLQPPSKRLRKRTLVSCFALLVALGVIVGAQNNDSDSNYPIPPDVPMMGLSLDSIKHHGEMKWRNPPDDYQEGADGRVSFTVPAQTDYWRVTFHDFIKDDGPFYYRKIEGDFEATVKFSGNYTTRYDQAGLMVRESKKVWMKCGVEFTEDGMQHASTVITRDFSDWSILPIPSNPETIWFKAKRTKECIETFYSLDGETYIQIRQGYLTTKHKLEVGIVAAAPRGDGFDVVFDDLQITQ